MPRDLTTILEGPERKRSIHEHLQWLARHGGSLRAAVEAEAQPRVIVDGAPIARWYERRIRSLVMGRTRRQCPTRYAAGYRSEMPRALCDVG